MTVQKSGILLSLINAFAQGLVTVIPLAPLPENSLKPEQKTNLILPNEDTAEGCCPPEEFLPAVMPEPKCQLDPFLQFERWEPVFDNRKVLRFEA